MTADATRRGLSLLPARGLATVPWRLARQAARRISWGLADQAMSSITNFAVSIYIARTLGAVQYGAFGLAYVTYSFALNASRGLSTDPLLVRFSGTDIVTWRRAVADCTGTAAVIGLVTGACVLVAAMVLDGSARLAFLALGLTLPGLMLQDSWRYSFFALGRGSQAFINDTIWAVTLIPALVLLRVTGHANVFWFVFAWGAAAAIGAAVGALQARVMPTLSGIWRWVWQHRDLGPRYLLEGTANSSSTQLRNYGVGIILGLAAVGYMQAASTLMGPFMVIFFGMGLVTLPEAARVLRRSPRHLALFSLAVSVGLTLLGATWAVVLLVALPHGLGHWMLGSIWRPTYPLVLPLAISILGGCVSAGASAGLHALGAARRSLRAMVQSSALFLACGLIGAAVDGPIGTMRGAAVAGCTGALMFWWQLRAALREHPSVPEGNWFWPGRTGRHRGSIASPADGETTAEAVSAEAAFASAGLADPELAELELAELESGERPLAARSAEKRSAEVRPAARRPADEPSAERPAVARAQSVRRPAEDERSYEPAVGRVHIGLPMDETMPMRAIPRRPPSDRRPAEGRPAERPAAAGVRSDGGRSDGARSDRGRPDWNPAEGIRVERPPSGQRPPEGTDRSPVGRPPSERPPADGVPTARPQADRGSAEGRSAGRPSAAGSRPDWPPAEGVRPERPSDRRPADGGPADRSPAAGRPQPRWIPNEGGSADRSAVSRPQGDGRPVEARPLERPSAAGSRPDWQPADGAPPERRPADGGPADRSPAAGRPQPRWIPNEGGSADRSAVSRPQGDGRPAERPSVAGSRPDWQPADGVRAERRPVEGESADRPPVAGRPQPRWIPAEGGSADRPAVARPQSDEGARERPPSERRPVDGGPVERPLVARPQSDRPSYEGARADLPPSERRPADRPAVGGSPPGWRSAEDVPAERPPRRPPSGRRLDDVLAANGGPVDDLAADRPPAARSRSERRLAEALAADRTAAEPRPGADWETEDAAPRGSARPKGGLAAAVERDLGRKGKS